jgi:hypothetical protein
MTKKEKQKKISKLRKKLIKALEECVYLNTEDRKEPFSKIGELLALAFKCKAIKDQIREVKNTPVSYSVPKKFRGESIKIASIPIIYDKLYREDAPESFPSMNTDPVWSMGFDINYEYKNKKINVKISKGEYYNVYKAGHEEIELNIPVPKIKESIRYTIYIYLQAGNIKYSLEDFPQKLTLKLYTLDVLVDNSNVQISYKDHRAGARTFYGLEDTEVRKIVCPDCSEIIPMDCISEHVCFPHIKERIRQGANAECVIETRPIIATENIEKGQIIICEGHKARLATPKDKFIS